MGTILMMSAKIVTLDFLKKKVFWNKGYDVITSVYDVTSKILSRDFIKLYCRFGHVTKVW